MSLPKTVSIQDIKKALRVYSTNDTAKLCTHFKVNKCSRRKPVRHIKKTELSDSDYAHVNFGFDLQFNESNGQEITS